ncbi:MAG: nickel ABC transporter permease [Rhodospirillum sp.]|jgi:peptide/nickel transport system permease protein|nr:nickel ABC transporter permease [Rhodospirillum sp.]
MTFATLTAGTIGRAIAPRWTLVVGATMLGLLILIAIAPGVVSPYDPLAFDYKAIMQPPSAAHWFGTDNFGRDVLSRTIWATRIDIQIAIFSTLFPLVFGTIVGTLTGYYGGWLDAIFGRLVDLVITFPFLVIVIAIVAVLGPGLLNMYIAVSAIGWVFYAQLIRAEIRVQKQSDYAAAARVLGYGEMRLIFRHLLPNAITPAIVYLMTDMALAILLGSSLGYLGLGAQPPTAEWGVIIAEGKNFMSTAWWISVFPGIAIVVAGVSFSMVGDGLADLFRRRR